MVWLIVSCKQIYDKFTEDEMSVYAAQASFFILLAAFPFFMVLLALIQVIPVVSRADLLAACVHVVPDSMAGLVIYILDSLYSDSPVTLLSVTALAALWSSSKGMLGIERGVNRVYGIDHRRPYLIRRLVCSGYTVLFCLLCVLVLALLVFGSALQRNLFTLVPELARFEFLISPARGLVSFGLLMVFFLALYTVLPYQKQPIGRQLPGAVFSAAGWILFSMAFSVYFKYFSSYAVTYGSLTAVILMMLWLYSGICILFLGAEVNCYFQRWNLPVPGEM